MKHTTVVGLLFLVFVLLLLLCEKLVVGLMLIGRDNNRIMLAGVTICPTGEMGNNNEHDLELFLHSSLIHQKMYGLGTAMSIEIHP